MKVLDIAKLYENVSNNDDYIVIVIYETCYQIERSI